MGRAIDDELTPGRTFLSRRGTVYVAYRLAARATIAGTLGAGATRRQRALLAAGTAADVVAGWVLGRRPGTGLRTRLVADVLETTYWGRQLEHADPAALLGLPLMFESGLRMEPRDFAATAAGATAVATSVAAGRRARGMPSGLASFRTHALGALSGLLFTRYERSRLSAAVSLHRAEVAARCQQARLAGQNAVAMGADSIVDLLSRTAPLLRLPGAESADPFARQLAEWKRSLADETTASATYLGVVVARWQRHANDAHPDLAADVVIDVAPGDGTVVLSVGQAGHLVRALDALDLRGRVRLSVEPDGRDGRPDRPINLQVGDRWVIIPPEPGGRFGPIDVGPIAFMISSLWALDRASSRWVMIRKDLAAGLAATNVGLAAWSHREIVRHGARARPSILAASFAMAVVDAVVVTRSVRQPVNPDGWSFFAAATSVAAPAALTSLYWRDLTSRQRLVGIVGSVAVVAIGLAVERSRPGLRSIVVELAWPLAAVVSLGSLEQAMTRVEGEVARSLEAEDEERIAAAFGDGRAAVIDLAARHYQWVRSTFDGVRDELDPRTRTELERRVTEVAARLEAL